VQFCVLCVSLNEWSKNRLSVYNLATVATNIEKKAAKSRYSTFFVSEGKPKQSLMIRCFLCKNCLFCQYFYHNIFLHSSPKKSSWEGEFSLAVCSRVVKEP